MTPNELNKIKSLDEGEVKWLKEEDYYDGPITGLVEWEGKEYYAVMVDDIRITRFDKPTGLRIYAVVDLTGAVDPYDRPILATFPG